MRARRPRRHHWLWSCATHSLEGFDSHWTCHSRFHRPKLKLPAVTFFGFAVLGHFDRDRYASLQTGISVHFFSYVWTYRVIKEALPISRRCLGCQCLKLPEIGRTQRPRRRVQIVIGLAWYRAGTPQLNALKVII